MVLLHKYIDPWNRIEKTERDPNTHGKWKYDKVSILDHRVKMAYLIGDVGTTGKPSGKK